MFIKEKLKKKGCYCHINQDYNILTPGWAVTQPAATDDQE